MNKTSQCAPKPCSAIIEPSVNANIARMKESDSYAVMFASTIPSNNLHRDSMKRHSLIFNAIIYTKTCINMDIHM